MQMIKSLLVAFLVFVAGSLFSQDLHFSMYNMSPLTLNPAHTGAFEGTFRIGGIYRDQWASVTKNQFVTPSVYVDAPILMVRKRDWVGVGGMLFSDKAGTSSLQTLGMLFSAAYHLSLDKKGGSTLTLGVQGGTVQRRIDILSSDLWFADEIAENSGGGGLGNGNSLDRQAVPLDEEQRGNKDYFDFTAGLMLKTLLSDNMDLTLGVSVGHPHSPNYAFTSQSSSGKVADEYKRSMRPTLHGLMNIGMSDKLTLSPSFIFQTTGGSNEIAVQALAGLMVKEDIVVKFGPGYRLNDAGKVILGLDYKDIKVGFAYDVNISSLSEVSKYNGGFEVAVSYIAKIFKDPEVPPVIFCPQL